MEINRIHYIIHPLWNLDYMRDGALKLVDNLLPVISGEGKRDDRLVIANMNDMSHYFHGSEASSDFDEGGWGMTFKEATQRLREDYTRLNKQIVDTIKSQCKNYFVKRPTYEECVPSGMERPKKMYLERFTPEFKSYLKENKLAIGNGSSNYDGHLIQGHGSDWDACVPGACGDLVKAIETELGKTVSFGLDEKTTL